MQPFLVGLVVEGRRCLVIGGDREAFDKARRLVAAGARVTVVAPEVVPALAALRATADLTWHTRGFEPKDLSGPPFLVVSALQDPAFSAWLLGQSEQGRFLLCCIDQPDGSNFTNAAVAQLGPVSLGLSSAGAVPGLLRRLRDDLVAGLGDEFPEFARYIAAVRATAAPEHRRAQVAQAITGFRVELLVHLPEGWRDRWRAISRSSPSGGVPCTAVERDEMPRDG